MKVKCLRNCTIPTGQGHKHRFCEAGVSYDTPATSWDLKAFPWLKHFQDPGKPVPPPKAPADARGRPEKDFLK